MPYCIECGAKLIPDGAVSCVVCGTTAYNPEHEAKKAEERAAREREREERRRQEARDREIAKLAESFFAESPQPRREKRRGEGSMMTAEDFFA